VSGYWRFVQQRGNYFSVSDIFIQLGALVQLPYFSAKSIIGPFPIYLLASSWPEGIIHWNGSLLSL
jgi:hypothetical protein